MKMKLVSASILATFLCAPVFAESPVVPVPEIVVVDPLVPVDPPLVVVPEPVVVVPPTLTDKATARAREFKAMDTDGDGFATWAEFKLASDAKRDAQIKAMFKLADKDGNGSLSSEEFLNRFAMGEVVSSSAVTQASTVFTIIDTDQNGILSPTELGIATVDGKPVGALMWAFARMDVNGDAKLAATEYSAKPVQLPKPPKLPKPRGPKTPPK